MEISDAAKALAALGHESRLLAYRLILAAGPAGLPAGEIARLTGLVQNTSSTHLSILSNAGLIRARREGRSIIYTAEPSHIGALLAFLGENGGET